MPFYKSIYPEKYLDMDLRTLIQQMSENTSLQYSIDTASAIMDMPLLMLNNYHRCIAHSNGAHTPDDSILHAIAHNGNITSLLNRSFDSEFVCIDPQGLGCLHCMSKNNHLSSKQKDLLPFLTWILFSVYNKSFERGFLFQSEESMLFHSLIKKEDSESIVQIQRFTQQIKKIYTEPWQIIVFFKPSKGISFNLHQKLPGSLQSPYSCSFSDKYIITLIHKLTTNEFDIYDRILKETNLRAGISYSFSELNKIRHYVQQAIASLQEATQIEAPFGLASYEKYLLVDLIYHSKNELLPYKLQHPILKELNNHAPHLYSTLQVYIQENCNTARASEVLHLHKNSVLYQLKQISKIAGYDITSAESIASLRYAFAINQFLTIHNK